ncbi:MAG TPA: hypothetical protein VF188_18430 [Longimicrobiales bacterium]
MNLLLRAAAAAALLLPLAVAPATAQNYRGAWGLYGGGIWFSDFNNDGDVDFDVIDLDFFPDGIIIDQFDDTDLGFADLTLDPGWIVGTQGEYWFGSGRFGLRLNGSYTERSLKEEFNDVFFNVEDLFDGDVLTTVLDGDDLLFGDVNTWFADGDLMFRIMRPRRDRVWAPFLSAGAGVAIYNPAGDGTIVLPESNAVWGDATINVVDVNGTPDVIITTDNGGNSETKFQTAFGIGTDILPGWSLGNIGIGLRFELVDHIVWDSPVEPLFGDDDFDPIHNVRLTAGVNGLFGRLFREERVAVVPPPAPPPPPAEEMITVCVIDPALPGGIREISAIYVPSTRDTLVTVNGNRVPLETATSRVMVASDADWFVRGEPLTLTVNGMTTEFVTYGGSRIVEPDDLTLLGTVDGLPVYADADDVRDVAHELERARGARDVRDLEDMLEENEDLRKDLADIEVLYVPVDPVGCVVQPVRRVEEVRKVRG